MQEDQINELIQAVRAGAKYQAVSEELVRAIGLRELAARRNLKEAIKATKNKLHQVAGAYFEARPAYDAWRERLLAAARGQARPHDAEAQASPMFSPPFRQACAEIMQHHASTRERLPILERFYATILGELRPRSVLDLACGLNPLARAWMPLAPGAAYYACDVYADMIAFLNFFFELAGIDGQAQICDLVAGPPRERVDLALLLKALPPLEQQARQAGRDLLRAIDARYILVSFPAQSLGGRGKGMAENYEQRFRALVAEEGWAIERWMFATELAFLVTK